MPSIIWVIVQVVLALGGAALWLRMIIPATAALRERRLVLSVWGPIVIVLPLLFLAASVDGSVAGAGRMVIGGPVVIGVVAVAAALLLGSSRVEQLDERGSGLGWFATAVWIGAGVVLLLLAAANVLNVMVGQCIFAAAAVVLWMNTPSVDEVQAARELQSQSQSPNEGRAAGGLFLAMIFAIAQGLALRMAGADAAVITTAIALAYALVIVIAAVARGGASMALSLGGWSAAFGVLFAIGLMSLLHMLPTVRETIVAGDGAAASAAARPTFQVARGFAVIAPEATALIVAGLAAAFAMRLQVAGRRMVGAILAVLAACLLTAALLLS